MAGQLRGSSDSEKIMTSERKLTVKAALAKKLGDQHFGNENVQSTVRRNQQKQEKYDQQES